MREHQSSHNEEQSCNRDCSGSDSGSLELRLCKRLSNNPPCLEPELEVGTWVILVVAQWSGPDLEWLPIANHLCGRLPNEVSMGVRLVNDIAELRRWVCGVEIEHIPVWLFMKNGIVEIFYYGGYADTASESDIHHKIDCWLKGNPKIAPPSDFERFRKWVASFFSLGNKRIHH